MLPVMDGVEQKYISLVSIARLRHDGHHTPTIRASAITAATFSRATSGGLVCRKVGKGRLRVCSRMPPEVQTSAGRMGAWAQTVEAAQRARATRACLGIRSDGSGANPRDV
eukprot:scaffold15254_cov73-Phaeocystis_antarctica.AAC.3